MTPPLVSIRDLSVSLGGNPVLKGLSADVARERITALIGLNGSGKTTLLKAILKEVPYSGRIDFHCGHDHRRQEPSHVGYVPQRLRIDANLPVTVRDLLALALQRRPLFLGVSRRVERILHELLEMVGSPRDLLDKPVGEISGGELQRVLLGLALQPHPELLLLDEPAAGIDIKFQEHFYDLIARVCRERQVTVLLVSHEMDVVSKHAHHVLCLKEGRVRCEGAPSEVVTREMLAQIFGLDKTVYAHHHSDS
ncbi:MAG: metal ABC transporter ATP-binding protein [Gemmataceae bacterium]|nr:metal ABC transporter ATP-binding protein [Gemmataceae bacterium]